MKKVFAILLALMLVSVMSVSAFAQSKNYSTKKWTADMGGKSTKTEKGVAFTGCSAEYVTPTIAIFKDLKTMMGDKEEIDFVIAFDVKAKFVEGEEENAITIRPLIRATAAGKNASVVKDSATWTERFEYYMDGDKHLISNNSGNLYANGLSEGSLEVDDIDWVHYETTETVTKKELTSDWFGEWRFCFDHIVGYEILDTLYVENFGLYLADEYEYTTTPTPVPTAEPTEVPAATETPDATDAPAEATEAPADEKKGCGSVLALGLLAAVIPAAVIVRKKED